MQVDINKGLYFASSIPYEKLWTRNSGILKNSPNATLPTYSAFRKLGKTQVTGSSTAAGSVYTGAISPVFPLSVLVGFIATATPVQFQSPLSCGGNDSGGWAIEFATPVTGLNWSMTGVSDTLLSGLASIAVGTIYFLLISVTANNGTVTGYMIDENDNFSNTAAIAIGAMTAPTGNMAVNCLGSTTLSDSLNGQVGMFAVWDRALTASEANKLLANPYQIWSIPSYGRYSNVSTAVTVNMFNINMNTQFRARW